MPGSISSTNGIVHPFGGRLSSRLFGESLHPDDGYLSYHDVRLTRGDVDTIKHDWLTDNVIAFWEEFLEHETLAAYPQARINLLRPSMVFLIVHTQDPLTLRDALPDFSQSTHIFLPINDNRAVHVPEGGTHWSLLLISIIDGAAFHYDSLRPSTNLEAAQITTSKMASILGRPLRFLDLTDSPQQDNSSDCGVFVCLTMKYLLIKRLLQNDASAKVSMSMRGKEINASKGRKTMMSLIDEFRREGKRSASRSESRGSPRRGSRSRSPPRVGN